MHNSPNPLSVRLSSVKDAAGMYRRVLAMLVEMAGASRGFIATPMRAGGPFQMLSTQGVSLTLLRRFRSFTLLPGSDYTAAVEARRPFLLSVVMTSDLQSESRLDRNLLAELGPVLMLPVYENEELMALVALNIPDSVPVDVGELLVAACRELIPELRRAQLLRALRRSEQHANTMLELLEEGVLLFDPEGNMVRANSAARRIAGVDTDADFPAAFDPRWSLMDTNGFLLPLDVYPVSIAIRQGQSVRDIGAIYMRPDGRQIVVSINATPLTEDQSERGAVVSFIDITTRHHLQSQLRAQALQEPLTGLPNRRALQQLLEHLCNGNADGKTMILLLCIERFKALQDRHGQQVAETLVRNVAQRLQRHLSQRGTVAHLSAHEFAVVMPMPDQAHADQFTHDLIGELTLPYEAAGVDVTSTFEAGYALHPEDGRTPSDLLRHADLAMQHGRQGDAQRWGRFRPDMAATQRRRMLIETHLHSAMHLKQLIVHYQPVVRLLDRRVTSLEALLRWTDPELGVVSPSEFVPVAESAGLIRKLGQYALCESLGQVRRWNTDTARPVSVNVNISASQLHQESFPDLVRQALADTGVPAGHLTLEVTEAVAVSDLPNVTRHLQELKDLGVQIALDDFGTGHSSLAMLTRLPIDVLKLDRLFVQNVHQHPRTQILLSNAVRLGLELGFQVVAEGVELQEELDFLLDCGCTHVQGYLLARPAPPEALTAWDA
jgi:diguanylate cyclase (GGDEF)-like protein